LAVNVKVYACLKSLIEMLFRVPFCPQYSNFRGGLLFEGGNTLLSLLKLKKHFWA
jgi:hypothetical protein